jgi:hypothetical protein
MLDPFLRQRFIKPGAQRKGFGYDFNFVPLAFDGLVEPDGIGIGFGFLGVGALWVDQKLKQRSFGMNLHIGQFPHVGQSEFVEHLTPSTSQFIFTTFIEFTVLQYLQPQFRGTG